MTPNYHFPLDLNENHDQPFITAYSSSLSSPASFFNQSQDHQPSAYTYHDHQSAQYQQDQAKIFVSQDESLSCDHTTEAGNENSEYTGLKFSICKNENQSESSSVKWMSSKMRFMRKMMNPNNSDHHKFEDQKQESSPLRTTDHSSNTTTTTNNNTIRVCADCNTTKTPLWRSGPRGPKSLCNACGIRQRKARRAMAAAAAAADGSVIAADTPASMKVPKVQHKEKRSSHENSMPKLKKKCKITSPSHGRKKLCFEDLTIILSKSSAFQRVFPQDEKEAAILLMALSYGLVHG